MVVRNDDIIYISDNNTTELGNIDTGIRGRDQCNDDIVLRRAFSQHIVERLGREMQAMTVSATTTYAKGFLPAHSGKTGARDASYDGISNHYL